MRAAAEMARARGFCIEMQDEVIGGESHANLIIRPSAKRPAVELLLQTHLDTPDPGPFGAWDKTGHNPFDAHIIDGAIYGLGTADTKLDFICKLEAMSAFVGQELAIPPVLVATFGEESGMVGALRLIRKNKISAKYALIGEPSNMGIFTAGKGFASVEIIIPFEEDEKKFRVEHNLSEGTSTQSRIFRGRAAHSSVPHLGESAIVKLFEYLLQLPENLAIMEIDGGTNFNTVPSQAFLEVDPVSGFQMPMSKKLTTIYRAVLELEQIFKQHRDLRFTPDHPTLNVGLLRTSDDNVVLSGTCRMPATVTTEVYESWMSRLQEVCAGVGAQFRVLDYKRPYQTDEGSSFVRLAQGCLREMGLSSDLKTHASTNEASLFSRVGINCISFGPGFREGNSHTPHEHVNIEDLKKAIEFYTRMIKGFCL